MTVKPLVIAHRGASGYRPEHTRAAYELAFEQGADAVEPDLVATSDGVLVIRHENEISGTTDVASHPEFAEKRASKTVDGQALTGWFTEDFTWAELSTLAAVERLPKIRGEHSRPNGILRLTDLLAMLDSTPLLAASGENIGMVAELKHANYFSSIGMPLDELFASELQAAGWADRPEQLVVESFELGVLEEVKARGIAARYVFLLEDPGSYLSEEGLASLVGTVDGVSLDKRIVLASADPTALVERIHAAGLSVFTWTLRAENKFLARGLRNGASAAAFGNWMSEYRTIMAAGVDGVFADQPDLAIQARASLSSP